MMAAYRWAIDDALQRHGLELPFPQQDVRIRSFFGSEGSEGMKAWRGEQKAQPHERAPAPPTGSINDAALEISLKQDEQDQIQMEAQIREAAAVMDEAGLAEAEASGQATVRPKKSKTP
jgi:hypothetical protein